MCVVTRAEDRDRPLWSGDEIAAATGGTLHGAFNVDGVAFDSREIGNGDLFVAMRGEHADGHDYLDTAFANGATGAIVERVSKAMADRPHVVVGDSMAALEALGRAARERAIGATIIGVTGSAGKTGTKEALFAALDRCAPGRAHRSVKSYNNHTGVPLSLARMPRDTRYGIFEMGMNHAGELAALTRMVRPHIALVTTIAPAHQEFFDSVEAIADAKAEIFLGLEPRGTAIIPHDSPYCARLRDGAERYADRIVSFGTGDGADVRATEWVAAPGGGSLITARLPEGDLCFTISAPGDHWVANAMAVIAAVEAAGGDLAIAGLALAELPGLAGRGARHRISASADPDGESVLLIDESYNANPASMAATIAQLGREEATRRIAILGAMKELGSDSAAFHANLAAPLLAARIDAVVLVGEEMAPLADRLAAKGVETRPQIAHLPDAAAARDWLDANLAPGDAVLVKGSNAVGLGTIVADLTRGS
ncbi:MAG: UDP-N-acetylmuramoyl-tripeptide--D-alanyl-D-alanine ligase [Sphingomonadales bacterium]|nr:UDP-N-acetylmuramoyl-tripeptide--D-alanyl-D-alanine ligase [Sphingomonadales bacterium]